MITKIIEHVFHEIFLFASLLSQFKQCVCVLCVVWARVYVLMFLFSMKNYLFSSNMWITILYDIVFSAKKRERYFGKRKSLCTSLYISDRLSYNASNRAKYFFSHFHSAFLFNSISWKYIFNLLGKIKMQPNAILAVKRRVSHHFTYYICKAKDSYIDMNVFPL